MSYKLHTVFFVFLFLLGFAGSCSGGGSISAPELQVLSFHCSASGEIEGGWGWVEAEEITQLLASRVTRRSSGWLTVTKRDEFAEGVWEFVRGCRAMRNPAGLWECLGGGAALGEFGRLVMGLESLRWRGKNEIVRAWLMWHDIIQNRY